VGPDRHPTPLQPSRPNPTSGTTPARDHLIRPVLARLAHLLVLLAHSSADDVPGCRNPGRSHGSPASTSAFVGIRSTSAVMRSRTWHQSPVDPSSVSRISGVTPGLFDQVHNDPVAPL